MTKGQYFHTGQEKTVNNGFIGPLPEAEMGPINSPPSVRPSVRLSVTLFLENRALDLSDFLRKVV